MKRNAADARAFVQRYAEETPHELEALANDVARLGRPELLPLDRTYASLDRVEDYYRLVLDAQAPGARKGARERVARYVGATLIEQAGGRWALDPYEGESMTVTGMRAVPGAVFYPEHEVASFEQWRHPGIVRDRTERHDLELQRRKIVELTEDLDATLARLRADVKQLTGEDPGPLDGTEALGRYGPALARTWSPGAPLELCRRLREGAAIVIGHLLRSALGPAEWSVEDAPRDVDLGTWNVFGIRVEHAVESIDAASAPDALRTMVEAMIARRRGKRRLHRTAPKNSKKKHATKPPPRRLGTWMVLCPSRRAVPVKQLLAKLDLPTGARARLVRQVLNVTAEEGVEVQVGLTRGKVVAAEAAEFAAEHGADRADRDTIAAYDARYEITWDLAQSDRAFETYYTLAYRITDLVRGITLDQLEGVFLDARDRRRG